MTRTLSLFILFQIHFSFIVQANLTSSIFYSDEKKLYCYEGKADAETYKIVECDGFCVHRIRVDLNYEMEEGQRHYEITERMVGCQRNFSGNHHSPNKCSAEHFDAKEPTHLPQKKDFPFKRRLGNGYLIYYNVGEDEEETATYKKCCRISGCNRLLDVPLHKRFPSELREAADDNNTTFPIMIIFILFCLIATVFLRIIYVRRKIGFRVNEIYMDIDPALIDPSPLKSTQMGELTGCLKVNALLDVIFKLDTEFFASTVSQDDQQDPFKNMKPVDIVWKNELVFTCHGYGHDLVRCVHERNRQLDGFLLQMLEYGPYEFPAKAIELIDNFDRAREAFGADPPVVEVLGNVTVIGDIRGRYTDLWRWLQQGGFPTTQKVLFLGGVIDDKEQGSIESIAFISALKVAAPSSVFLLRGVPETVGYAPRIRFPRRIAGAIGGSIRRLCAQLPLAAIVNKKIFCTYSGIPISHVHSAYGFTRPCLDTNLPRTAKEHIFGKPLSSPPESRKKKVSTKTFGKNDITKVLAHFHCDLFVRARNPSTAGHVFSFKNRMLTLWSAPGKFTSRGSALQVTSSNELSVITMCEQSNESVHGVGVGKAKRPNITKRKVKSTVI